MESQEIRAAFDKIGADKGWRHGYEKAYSTVFEKVVPDSIVEVGIQRGKSLVAWNALFPACKLTGIDIQDGPFVDQLKDVPFNKIIHSSTDPTIASLVDECSVFIDDGDHSPEAICRTFDNLFSKAKQFYIIEDVVGWRHEQRILNHIASRTEGMVVRTFQSEQWHNFKYNEETVSDCFRIIVICKDPALEYAGH